MIMNERKHFQDSEAIAPFQVPCLFLLWVLINCHFYFWESLSYYLSTPPLFFSSNIAFCCLRVWFSNLWCSLIYCVDKASWFCIYFSLVTWGIQHKHILFLITEGKALGFLISHRASLVQRHRCHGRELHTPQCYYSSCNTKSPLKSSMQGSTVWLEPFESSILVPQVRHQEISTAINHITK